jgi:phage/plasmid primase-like uncharacterized protein
MSAYESDFRAALSAAGISLPPGEAIIADDQIHRWAGPKDKAKEQDCYYALHLHPAHNGGEPFVNGIYGHWNGSVPLSHWSSRALSSLSREEARSVAESNRALKKRMTEEELAGQEKARTKCKSMFATSPRATAHPYLAKKGITASPSSAICAFEPYPGWLAVPLQDAEGTIWSAQLIADDGTKRFMYESRVKGCYHQFSEVNHGGPILICEGYATGASLFMSTGWTVACAMNCGNLESIARSFRARYPDRTLLIAADNDQFTADNPGLTKGKAAARAAKALLSFPEFADEALAEKPTDFNDLHRLAGLSEVSRQVQRAIPELKILSERQFNPNIQPPPLRSVYLLDGKTICTPANLSSITSAIKTGKSSALCAMMAASFPKQNEEADLLSFESENPKGLAIVHIDSEQAPDDHWHQIYRMLRRVGLKKPPDWFYSYCLKGLGYKQIRACYVEALRMAADRHGGIHSSVLDGIADLVSDVNDPAECNDFIAHLDDLSICYDCPISGVIHFNPGTEKTRGHLGSQFERKAETNLRLDKTNDVTTIWSEKQRRAPIFKGTGPSFRWDDQLQMHVSCEPSANGKKPGAPSLQDQIATINSHEFLAACPAAGEGKKEIARRLEIWLLTQRIDASFDTCKRSLARLVANGKLTRDIATGLYIKGTNA